MMDRLTQRIDDHYIARTERLNGKIIGNQMCLDKLGELEDAEEQGLLLRLRCKAETRVYAILRYSHQIAVCETKKIVLDHTYFGDICYFVEPIWDRGSLYKYFENDFGKTIFLSCEEAGAGLKKMEAEE